MVEEARLESVYTPKGYRGFESRFLRKEKGDLYKSPFFLCPYVNVYIKVK